MSVTILHQPTRERTGMRGAGASESGEWRIGRTLGAYEESAFAARALLDRIGPSGLGQLLHDLGTGQTIEQATARSGCGPA